MRLLLVEDDRALAEAVAEGLRRRGMTVDHVATSADAEMMIEAIAYEAIVLDRGLSDGDGLALVRRLRAKEAGVPVLILSARSDVPDRLAGFDAGADDYLPKPFDMDELAARARALIRRGHLRSTSLAIGNIEFDTVTGELLVAGAMVELSVREREIMTLLLRRPGRVATKRHCEDQLFGLGDPVGSNAVEVYVHRLRRKLEAAGATVSIDTVRGVGYLLRDVA